MTREDFISRVRKEYLFARKAFVPDPKITRGTGRSISSLSEDIFAKYISGSIPEECEVWIDPQISVKNHRTVSGKRTKIFRPDVCVYNQKEKRVELIFDLKMDLGYSRRGFIDFSDKRQEELARIKEHQGMWTKNTAKIEFDFNRNLRWNYVVLSVGNISRQGMQETKDHFEVDKSSRLFLLTSDGHLNSKEEPPKYTINTKAFDEIDSLVKQACG